MTSKMRGVRRDHVGVGGDSESQRAKPLRRDAELNLARIMEAARDVFAASGYDGSMEQIAARADVGIGTLYRRFPDKEQLFNAVTDVAKERTIRIAEEVLVDVRAEDALSEFLRRCIAAPSCWRVTTTRPPWNESTGVNSVLKEISPAVEAVLRVSQQAGIVRSDVVFSDVVLVLMSVRAVADLCGARAPDAPQRFLELLVDGLRPGGTSFATAPMSRLALSRVLTHSQS